MDSLADYFINQISRLSEGQAYFLIGGTALVAILSINALIDRSLRTRSRTHFRDAYIARTEPTMNLSTDYARTSFEKPFLVQKDIVPRAIMNRSEMSFYSMLAGALPNHLIFTQVSFNAMVTHGPWLEKRYFKRVVRSKFNTKYVDFVICTKLDFKVYAVIEYDGQGHDKREDAVRDVLLRSAGYRVERFTHLDSVETIKHRFS